MKAERKVRAVFEHRPNIVQGDPYRLVRLTNAPFLALWRPGEHNQTVKRVGSFVSENDLILIMEAPDIEVTIVAP